MDDAQLIARARGGDLESFGQLYDRYFHRVYDVAWRVVRNAAAAADITQEVFASTARDLALIPKSQTFASWLFTITHHAAVARAERTSSAPAATHEEAFGSFSEPDPCRIDNPAQRPRDAELPALIWEALTALGPRDYALLDLHMRQGLDSADLAHVLDVSKGNAYTMVARMKGAAGEAITGYIVARRGSGDCPALQQQLASLSFPPYTDEARRAVGAHIAACATCRDTRARIGVDALEVFGAFAPVPAPMALKSDTWRALSSEWNAPPANNISATAIRPLRGDSPHGEAAALPAATAAGFSLADGGARRGSGDDAGSRPPSGWAGAAAPGDGDRNRIIWFAGAVAALLIVAFAGAAVVFGLVGGGGDGTVAGGATTRTPSVASSPTAAGTAPGVAVQTPTANRTPSATPLPSETATALPDTPVPPPPPATATSAPVRQTPTAAAATATRPAAATATPARVTPGAGTPCPPGGCNLNPP